MARCIDEEWKHRKFQRELIPHWCMSDNTNAGPACTTKLGRAVARCACHVYYIPVRTVFFPLAALEWYSKPPRRPTMHDLHGGVLVPLENLRHWATFLADPTNFAAWCTRSYAAPHGNLFWQKRVGLFTSSELHSVTSWLILAHMILHPPFKKSPNFGPGGWSREPMVVINFRVVWDPLCVHVGLFLGPLSRFMLHPHGWPSVCSCACTLRRGSRSLTGRRQGLSDWC